MKKITTIIATNLFAIVLFAQIPNGSFENWTSKGQGLYDVPDQWGTMNNTIAKDSVFTVEKGTPGNPGSSYLRIIAKAIGTGTTVVNGIAVSGKLDSISMKPKSGFAYTGQPKSFTGNWQFMWHGTNGAGSVSATLTKWNASTKHREVVATAIDTLDGMVMSWAAFSIDFAYASGNIPDSCIIVLEASGSTPTEWSYLYVDDLTFTGTVASVPDNSGFINSMHVYPNPSAENIMVDFNLNKPETVKIQMLDLNGKLVKEADLGSVNGYHKYTMNTDGIAKGRYFVNLISMEGTESKKIVIE